MWIIPVGSIRHLVAGATAGDACGWFQAEHGLADHEIGEPECVADLDQLQISDVDSQTGTDPRGLLVYAQISAREAIRRCSSFPCEIG